MFRKSSVMIALMGSFGLPYVYSNSAKLTQALSSSASTTPAPGDNAFGVHPADAASYPQAGAAPRNVDASGKLGPLPRVTPLPLNAVFRWDMSTAWVLSTWSRVSTSLADLDLKGYRVPLVTGTADGDLAGSLTYYFNTQQQLERIVFQGTTGDARPLVHFMATYHQFARQVTRDPGEYVYQAGSGKKRSEMRITVAPVVRQDDARARFTVALTMERPGK